MNAATRRANERAADRLLDAATRRAVDLIRAGHDPRDVLAGAVESAELLLDAA